MASPDPSTTALPLIFGPFDPSGSSNLPIDAVICARLGAHAGCVATAIHVQDTAGIETIQRLMPELVDDQARCLLEDMPIGALKIGPQYDPETISALAQIAADYSTLPLVLHLCNPPTIPDLEDLDPEDTVHALLDLLAPQALVAVIDAALPDLWVNQGLLAAPRAQMAAEALHELGVEHVLCCNATLGAGLHGLVLHSQGQPGRRWPWPAPQVRTSDSESLLATLLTCLLASGLEPAVATEQAVTLASPMLAQHFHPGMGQRILRHTTT